MITLSPDELIVDSFAGGGGASQGIYMATGRHPDVAINHDPEAVAMHRANHPSTDHYCQSIYQVDPDDIVRKYKRRIGLAWFSPDCTHHSKARGGKPKEKHIRDLAWVVVHWAERAVYHGKRIRVICIENVEEFKDWGPLQEDGKPCPIQKGFEFQRWVKALRKLGYKVEWRELRACDYGAPTIRKRLFVVARCDGQPIVWPAATHGPDRPQPYHTAAECINWSKPCPSIFLTKDEGRAVRAKRPLAAPTMRRVAHGIKRFVLDTKQPYIVNLTHQGAERVESIDDPLRTVTGAHRGEKALVIPYLTEHANASTQRIFSADEPTRTQCAQVKGGHFALCAGTMVQMGYGEREGQAPRSLDPEKPLGTVVAGGGKHAVAIAHIQRQFGNSIGSAAGDPVGTITAGGGGKTALAAAFLAQHNSERGNGVKAGRDLNSPASTVTASGSQQALVTSHLVKLHGTCQHGQPADAPLATIRAQGTHIGVVSGHLMKYYGTDQAPEMDGPLHTITSKDRFGFVRSELNPDPLSEAQLDRARQVAGLLRKYGFWDEREYVALEINGVAWIIVDIGMRMLSRRELFNAQGFPPDYIIAPIFNGKPMTNTASVRMCGNSVSPNPACAVVKAQFDPLHQKTDTLVPMHPSNLSQTVSSLSTPN